MNSILWAQLRGMAWYEFRMHWRRRGLLVITLAMTVMLGFSMIVLSDGIRHPDNIAPELYRQVLTATIIFSTWAPIGITLAVVLPVMVADTIPLDRQHGMRDLLDSTPLSPGVYLMGKLLGVWASVLAGMGAVMVLSGIAWWILGGPFNIGSYFEMWIVGVAGIAILNSGLGVLVCATQPNRRRAILLSVVLVFLSITFLSGSLQGNDFLGIASPLRGAIISYYLFNVRQSISTEMIAPAMLTSTNAVLLTIIVGALELAAGWALMTGWMRRRSGYS
jgi:hypothetical protein